MTERIVDGVAPNQKWRHRKTGGTYVVVGVGSMQSQLWVKVNGAPVDMSDVVVYRPERNTTEFWVRPIEDFLDGRFEQL